MIRTVLFDLDGTLADTAPDLAYALNALLAAEGRRPRTLEEIRPVASHGSPALLRLGFGVEEQSPAYEPLRQRFLALYRTHIARETRLFPGMVELLEAIEESGRSWGVVTNKPAFLTEPLLEALRLTARAAAIVSGDTLPERKPHPAPMLLASRNAGSEPGQCIYVGDAERDIEAGRAAGMLTVIAEWGYIAADERPEAWGADLSIAHPDRLPEWIERWCGEGRLAG